MESNRKMKCDTCTKRPEAVPYIVHETTMARMERTVRRLWILLIIVIVLFVGSNAAWIFYENSFEDISITQENEDGYNAHQG